MVRQSDSAFTLVEIAIVLAIIAVIAGGVLLGQNLISASELRKVGTDLENYYTSTLAFKQKYKGYPGDLKNAEFFWGELESDPAACKITPSTSELTCNGNGDGRVYPYTPGTNEAFRFWQHLSNAGMLSSKYTGVSGAGGEWEAIPYENSPVTNGGKATITLDWQPQWNGHPDFFDGKYGNTFLVSGNGFSQWRIFSPVEMFKIESKFDDKKPGLGRIRARKNTQMPNCTTNNDADTAEYIFTNETPSCYFQYIWD